MLLLVIAFLAGAIVPIGGQAPARRDGHGRARLDEFNRALGVDCAHCHEPDRWEDDSKAAKATARRMIEMVPALNAKLRGIGEVSCWTCHRGQVKPSRVAPEALDAELTRWPASVADASQGTKLTMAVYSVSTGLRCSGCHDITDWTRVDTDRMRKVPRMLALFGVMPAYMPPGAVTQCYTCHKGSNKPERRP